MSLVFLPQARLREFMLRIGLQANRQDAMARPDLVAPMTDALR